MATREEMSRSFGAAAGIYESGRPDYPQAAVAWMLEPVLDRSTGSRPRVADIGAGTGKLTRVVTGLGAKVVAVEPDAAMLAVLSEALPNVEALAGTAECLPLPDSAVDGAVFGQAWHWVEPVGGSAEVGRVLRPGGMLGLIWNIRDDRLPWMARLAEILHPSAAEALIGQGGPRLGPPFGDPEARTWEWSRPMTRATLHDMVFSRSYVITAEDGERGRIERELAVFLDEIGAVAGDVVELPYLTSAYRAVRP